MPDTHSCENRKSPYITILCKTPRHPHVVPLISCHQLHSARTNMHNM